MVALGYNRFWMDRMWNSVVCWLQVGVVSRLSSDVEYGVFSRYV